MTAALELRGISKRYGPVEALAGVDFSLQPGEIHALLGENGAGKSTLMKIAFGLVRPDAGQVIVDGRAHQLRDPVAAKALGIGMVHQHFTSVPAFTVLENVALAGGWRFDPASIRPRLEALSRTTGLDIPPDARAESLSAGLKQRLEVLQALAAEARILLLDEPSSVLAPTDADSFLQLVRTLRDSGVASVLITHKLSEALAIADRVTVLRRGRVVHTGPAVGETADSLAAYMLGEAPPPRFRFPSQPLAEITVLASDLAVPRLAGSGSGLRHASLRVRAGEVVGVAAVEGNGQRELLRVIAGIARHTRGTLEVLGPVSFVPEDRTSEGMIGGFSLTENLVLSQGGSAEWVRGPWIDWRAAADSADALIARFGVRASGSAVPARTLSGGNQQRFLIAEALARRPRVLVAENPTRGLDLRATDEVHQRLREAAAAGVSVLVHLADLDELLELADRSVVLASGQLLEPASSGDRVAIARLMLGAGT